MTAPQLTSTPATLTWGGARKGAGRKKTTKRGGFHRLRPALAPWKPVHVVLRVKKDVPRLRTGRAYRAIRRVLVRYLGREGFRVVHLSIQHNHIHFLVEAAGKRALGRGMQSLAINCARALNAELGRRGKVFAYRYHATQITTPRQARNTLAYVLNNWRHHREDLANAATRAAMLDPYSSAVSFDGWHRAPKFAIPASYKPLPVSRPRTDLLANAWLWFGKILMDEVPGEPVWTRRWA
jgi:REP element-mobilizing transposase RayT